MQQIQVFYFYPNSNFADTWMIVDDMEQNVDDW